MEPDDRLPLTLTEVRANIEDPRRWVSGERLLKVIAENPSLRGFTYGYVAEEFFADWLTAHGVAAEHHSKDDDHKKTKADRTLRYRGRVYAIQLKSLQTNSIRQVGPGSFRATVQNDASDNRQITLPNGDTISTTCYAVGEYHVLAVSLQPFTGDWTFAFKRNRDLRRSTHRKYTAEQQQYLLATTEQITYPLSAVWTLDLFSLLTEDLGDAIVIERVADHELTVVRPPNSAGEVIVRESVKENKSNGASDA